MPGDSNERVGGTRDGRGLRARDPSKKKPSGVRHEVATRRVRGWEATKRIRKSRLVRARLYQAGRRRCLIAYRKLKWREGSAISGSTWNILRVVNAASKDTHKLGHKYIFRFPNGADQISWMIHNRKANYFPRCIFIFGIITVVTEVLISISFSTFSLIFNAVPNVKCSWYLSYTCAYIGLYFICWRCRLPEEPTGVFCPLPTSCGPIHKYLYLVLAGRSVFTTRHE